LSGTITTRTPNSSSKTRVNMMPPLLSVESVGFSYSENGFILNDINLLFEQGKFYSVIGRNGSGKSTLIKLITGLLKDFNGNILFEQKNISSFSAKYLARKISYIPQHNAFFDSDIKVADFLTLGRYSYKPFTQFRNNKDDADVVEFALDLLSINDLADKNLGSISGGEKQKVIIALSLVQLNCKEDLNGKVLVVDEPLTYLDVHYQFDIFNVLRNLNKEKGLTIVTVTHDLNIAIKYTDETILLENGSIVSKGNTLDIITEDTLNKYFMIKSQVVNFENEYHINFIPN
jgi:iron complex transport system ATP-binding protein